VDQLNKRILSILIEYKNINKEKKMKKPILAIILGLGILASINAEPLTDGDYSSIIGVVENVIILSDGIYYVYLKEEGIKTEAWGDIFPLQPQTRDTRKLILNDVPHANEILSALFLSVSQNKPIRLRLAPETSSNTNIISYVQYPYEK